MAADLSLFVLLFVLFGGTLVSLLMLHRIGLPPIIGYVAIGVLIGPEGFSLFGRADDGDVGEIAELGVMSLMFVLGLKFSITQLRSLRRYVIGIGATQVAICMLVPLALFMLLPGGTWYAAVAVGAVVAMSSTAIVSELLINRGEINSPHGLRCIAVLLFQDLAVILLLILLSVDATDFSTVGIAGKAALAAGVLGALLVVAPRVLPRVVSHFAATRSNEILTIGILSLATGMALMTHFAGLSLALGAFLAGMLLSESTLRYRVEELVKPFKEVLLGFFFVSIGMLVSVDSMAANVGYILLGTIILLTLKPLAVYGCVRLAGTRHLAAFRTAVLLGGTGEFGFVLLTEAASNIESQLLDILLGVNMLGMIAVPLVLPFMGRLEQLLAPEDWLVKARDATRVAAQAAGMHNHVIIIGFGRSGQMAGRMLKNVDIPWIAIENDHERQQAASAAGERVVYGDARDRELLLGMGLLDARAVIVAHHFQAMAVRNVEIIREVSPDIPIIAKVYAPGEVGELRAAGANFVLVASLAAGATLAEQTMLIAGVPERSIREQMGKAKEDSQTTTAFFASISSEEDNPCLFTVPITEGFASVSMTVSEARELLETADAGIASLRRGEQDLALDSGETLAAGDIVVLLARPSQITLAEQLLQAGGLGGYPRRVACLDQPVFGRQQLLDAAHVGQQQRDGDHAQHVDPEQDVQQLAFNVAGGLCQQDEAEFAGAPEQHCCAERSKMAGACQPDAAVDGQRLEGQQDDGPQQDVADVGGQRIDRDQHSDAYEKEAEQHFLERLYQFLYPVAQR